MGHVRLGTLPTSASWQDVVSYIEHGGSVEQVAEAAVCACESSLRTAARDSGVVESVWLLIRLTHAARSRDFGDALADLGIPSQAACGTVSLACGFADAVDAALRCGGRTDLGEMAQMAAVETLFGLLGDRAGGLFDPSPEDVRAALSGFVSPAHFGLLARAFFARLAYKALDYYLSRTLSDQVGQGRRFLTLARLAEFCERLETHCSEASAIVSGYCPDWVAKVRYEHGEVTREATVRLVRRAMGKMIKELKRRAGHSVE